MSYLRREQFVQMVRVLFLFFLRLIFPRINGPIVIVAYQPSISSLNSENDFGAEIKSSNN